VNQIRNCIFVFPAAALVLVMNSPSSRAQEPSGQQPLTLTAEQVSDLAGLALKGLDQEYPNKPGVVLHGNESLVPPSEQFPAFFGCFDWHSSVHGHWMLVRLIRLHPEHSCVEEIVQRLDTHLTAERLAREAEIFRDDLNRSFERMYGWAWVWRLVAELEAWNDPRGNRWRENLRPLEEVLTQRAQEYLPRLT
jgi:hypothetical protein